jgi:hypothetical protein
MQVCSSRKNTNCNQILIFRKQTMSLPNPDKTLALPSVAFLGYGEQPGPDLTRALAKRSYPLQSFCPHRISTKKPAVDKHITPPTSEAGRSKRISLPVRQAGATIPARVRTSLPVYRVALALITLLLISKVSFSQLAITPRPSPLAMATARYKDTYLKIVYGQPHKRGREIFGKTVPFGQVWRTGANESSEITVTKDILISNQLLKAGTYSIYSIPEKNKWTIIINSDVGMWGSYNYNILQDVLRFEAPVETLNDVVYEPFTILIDQQTDKATISLLWDKTKVTFPIQFQEPK